VIALEKHLRGLREAGRKALVVYLTGGVPDTVSFVDHVRAAAEGGADVIEIGIPWSDPVIDGPVIQRASELALRKGVSPTDVLDAASVADVGVPVVAMTYYNPVLRMGVERFAGALASRGLAGAIVPDLPLEESRAWEAAAGAAGVAAVLLAAPNASGDRLTEICQRATGFVYAMSLLGVTGVRPGLPSSAIELGDRLRALTDLPVLLGIGISGGPQAAEAARHADGVIVGSALVRRVLDGAGPEGVASFTAELRRGLDGG
jgi:tryptophan synthase alpha chain